MNADAIVNLARAVIGTEAAASAQLRGRLVSALNFKHLLKAGVA